MMIRPHQVANDLRELLTLVRAADVLDIERAIRILEETAERRDTPACDRCGQRAAAIIARLCWECAVTPAPILAATGS